MVCVGNANLTSASSTVGPQAPSTLWLLMQVTRCYWLYIGIADGMPIARVWARRYSK